MLLSCESPGETGFVALPASRLTPPPVTIGTGLAASYFNNTSLSGSAVLRSPAALGGR